MSHTTNAPHPTNPPHRTDTPQRTDTPGVGLMGAWFDPSDPAVWSGMIGGVIDSLQSMGLFAGYRDVTPVGAATLLRLRRAAGRADHGWTLGADMRWLAPGNDVVRRHRRRREAEGWIVPVGGIGRPAPHPYVTLSELTPAQYLSIGPARASAFGFPGLTRRRLARLTAVQQATHRRATACCVVSRSAADSLVRDHGIDARRVHVVGCGRNIDIAPDPRRDWSQPRYLFVGHDWARKNGDVVVRAFARVRRLFPDARLDLVGGHPAVDAAGVTGHGRLRFAEPEDRGRLEALFRQATCFVMPSDLEPFGIAYVEAAAAGVASIATTVGGTDTSVGEAGIFVDPGDEDALVHAMLAFADPDTARQLGARACERARDLTWGATTRRIVDAFGQDAFGVHRSPEVPAGPEEVTAP